MKFWVTQDRLVVDTATADLRGGLQDATEGTVTASAGGWTGETAPASDGSWRLSVPLAVGVNEITVTATDGAGLTSTWTGTVIRLITDRVKADLDSLNAILRRFAAGTETEADWAALNAPNQRGAYNDTDLNRVSAAAELVYQSLVGQGISVDYAPVELERPRPGRLPEGYTELEYIESTGTQYIDTGFKPTGNSRVVCDIQLSGTGAWLYGARHTATDRTFMTVAMTDNYRSDYNNSYSLNIPYDMTDRVTIDKNKGSMTIGTQTVSYEDADFSCAYNLYIFAGNSAGAPSTFSSMKLFYCKVYDNDLLIRDYIPCQGPSGDIGLYDTENNQFYENAGTGTFTAGPEIPPEPGEGLDPYTWYESDTPTAPQMAQYLSNVANLLGARLVQAQFITIPASMASLTLAGANNIEWALVCVDAVTPVARKSYIYSGEAMAGEF